jgi:hypothetical protein
VAFRPCHPRALRNARPWQTRPRRVHAPGHPARGSYATPSPSRHPMQPEPLPAAGRPLRGTGRRDGRRLWTPSAPGKLLAAGSQPDRARHTFPVALPGPYAGPGATNPQGRRPTNSIARLHTGHASGARTTDRPTCCNLRSRLRTAAVKAHPTLQASQQPARSHQQQTPNHYVKLYGV